MCVCVCVCVCRLHAHNIVNSCRKIHSHVCDAYLYYQERIKGKRFKVYVLLVL